MKLLKLLFVLTLISFRALTYGQEVPILAYGTDINGQVQLEVSSSGEHYYLLKVRHDSIGEFDLVTSMTLGKPGTTMISEPLGSYPVEHYQVLEYVLANPMDIDGDGIDDLTEYLTIPLNGPINAAPAVDVVDGAVVLESDEAFDQIAISKDYVELSEFLNGMEYVKFIIVGFHTKSPWIYFINGLTHDLHFDFANTVGISNNGDNVKKGQIIYHPGVISDNGTTGLFTFNYSNGHGQDFDVVQRTHELLATNMPFLKNNLSYYITPRNADEFERDALLFDESRIPLLFEDDVYAGLDYWGLNPAEGYGYFRHMTLSEIPGPRDIVLYDALPNSLPRVGGIITSAIQTPLSHVNLRAIQDKIPNAFIRDPLSIDSIANLIDHYIYFSVQQNKYVIREASLVEVNDWYDHIRPQKEQTPPINLSYTSILPLEDIHFEMFDGFGAKCANVATMRTFGFPEGTIPDGFGVPFYFYREFMKHNQFFDEVESMMSDPEFAADRNYRDQVLADFRQKIKKGDMPDWMRDELMAMHESFPPGTSVRCRSSTNNEDLPGFSGAGLYDSKTQHPNEGHISKSIQQVYASLWNLRAFEEREFYRIDHFNTAMGVLCHPNYSEEKANGVGVSVDPIYQTSNTFYLNTQVGEELITNPDFTSSPEEILLDRDSNSEEGYVVVEYSSLLPNNSIILEEHYLDLMRDYLTVIHDQFEVLYHAENRTDFAMDIEYKITSDDRLIIKQARPWVTYAVQEDTVVVEPMSPGLIVYPNPVEDDIDVHCVDCHFERLRICDLLGRLMQEILFSDADQSHMHVSIKDLPRGVYILSATTNMNGQYVSKKLVKH